MKAILSPWPLLALCFNALVWGVSWWPFRWLESHGLHPLWSTALIYAVAVTVIVVWRPQALRTVAQTPTLWVLIVASGATNAAFNWGVVVGDVVRVVLLFYLMPLWVAILARLILKEPLRWRTMSRVALSVLGAGIVLQPAGGGLSWPVPASLPDWLGLIGGFTFALNNVMLRREAHRPEEARALAMFIGGVAVSGTLATVLAVQQSVTWPLPVSAAWLPVGLGLCVAFLLSNFALQYGAARVPANVASVVMLTEVLFASASAVLLGGESLTLPLLAGGALILMAAAMAAWQPSGSPDRRSGS